MRASLNRNVLPQPDSVRVEEMINYFPYAYPAPVSAGEPFRTNVSVFRARGRRAARSSRSHQGLCGAAGHASHANLVFLIDTSGSMEAPNRLPLVKHSLALLLSQLDANDRVAIVTYAGKAA